MSSIVLLTLEPFFTGRSPISIYNLYIQTNHPKESTTCASSSLPRLDSAINRASRPARKFTENWFFWELVHRFSMGKPWKTYCLTLKKHGFAVIFESEPILPLDMLSKKNRLMYVLQLDTYWQDLGSIFIGHFWNLCWTLSNIIEHILDYWRCIG
jgi:hypothetical protein